MNHTSHTALTRLDAGLPPQPEKHREEHVAALGGARGAPVPTTVTSIPREAQASVPDHVVWSLFNTLFLNVCCLGFIAYAYSVKARDRKMVGDLTGAQAHASTAKCLNICALVFGSIVAVICLAVFITSLQAMMRVLQEQIKHSRGY